jgi:hypothetical protein
MTTSLRVPMTSLGAPTTILGAPRVTVEPFGKNIFFGNTAGAPGNHSYYISFNNFENSCIQSVFPLLYLYGDTSTHGISELAASGA